MDKYKFSLVVVVLLSNFINFGCYENKITQNLSNKNSYFTETMDISKVDNGIEAEIKQLYIDIEPQFYKPDIFTEKKELSLIKEISYNMNDHVQHIVSYHSYGFSILSAKSSPKSVMISEDIIMNKSKYIKNLLYMNVFDEANNVGYYVKDKSGVYCYKLLDDKSNLSWKLNFNNAHICKNALGNNIVLYSKNDLIVIDTKTAKVIESYQLNNNLEIVVAKPFNNMILLMCIDVNKVSQNKDMMGLGTIYVIERNDSKMKFYKFKDDTQYIKIRGDDFILKFNSNIFVVNKNLNVKHTNLSSLFKNIETSPAGVIPSEVNYFIFKVGANKYVLDIDNPSNLIKCAQEQINLYNTRIMSEPIGFCYKDKDNYYGYDVDKHESTWKIKHSDLFSNNNTVFYTTENGILVVCESMSNNKINYKVFSLK